MTAADLIRTYGWSGPEVGRHQFTRNADNTCRERMGWTMTAKNASQRYCINAAVAKVYFGTTKAWCVEVTGVHIAQVRLAQRVVQGPVVDHDYPTDFFNTWSLAISILARWQDAEGRTADEVIALLDTEGL